MQPFGQTAVQLGLLNQSQLQILIAHQARLQKKIGEFFLEHNLLPPEKLRRLIIEHQKHNDRILEGRRETSTLF